MPFFAFKIVSIFEWAVLGALFLAVCVFCARVMRKGIKTLDQRRGEYLEAMRAGEARIGEERKNISSAERVDVAYAALLDLARLNDFPSNWKISRENRKITLDTPEGVWTLELLIKESKLKSTGKILRGQGKWSLRDGATTRFYADPGELFGDLVADLRHEEKEAPEPEHFARRVAAARSLRRGRKA